MAEKERTLKELNRKSAIYRQRRRRLWIWTIVELVILLILNPGFIPGISPAISAINTFFSELLWPNSAGELDSGTYRAYIYLICTFIEELPFYSVMAFVIPRILPAWLLLTYIQTAVVALRIKHLNKSAEGNKPKATKTAEPGIAIGPKVGGLTFTSAHQSEKKLKELQELCEEFRDTSGMEDWELDLGLWIRNWTQNGNKQPDVFRGWNEGMIELEAMNQIVRFQLINGQAYVLGNEGEKTPIAQGVPVSVIHSNSAENPVRDMTVIWLGRMEL